ncbi:sensor histidine kinase [Tellurirhabdus bombi]|uniref:sensor histidine kinase n=1 Tax=Tellurirhabdus bombi TaxID=2907205 RepID=UPI001F3E7D6B|nr:HAMP domain-containing sensor histidine kinase [Tellurirhabdus bombi]
MLKSFDIYGQRNTLKIIVALNLLLVGTASLLYTNRLIKKLEDREESYVRLYAKAMTYVQKTDYNEDINFVAQEIIFVNANSEISAIYVDENGEPAYPVNINFPADATPEEKQEILQEKLAEMKEEHPPVEVEIGKDETGFIYYSNSLLLTQLRFFPYVMLTVMVVLGFLAYLAFSSARRAEQNRVWVGLAKETAHQLGTPLSSLMAWVEYFRSDPAVDESIADEIEKDVKRLETIAARFSSIGSIPTLRDEDVHETVANFISYLQPRISTKVKMSIDNQLPPGKQVHINKLLFEWVIENVSKNAVDAMGGIGSLTIKLHPVVRRNMPGEKTSRARREIAIDITDTGKGISKANLQKVFTPGYSTKKRGWGLGLTLAKRIIEEYHDGRLFVKSSEIGKGTTFRIVLQESEMIRQQPQESLEQQA